LSIDKSLIDPSKPEALEKAVLEAINDALNNVRLYPCFVPISASVDLY